MKQIGDFGEQRLASPSKLLYFVSAERFLILRWNLAHFAWVDCNLKIAVFIVAVTHVEACPNGCQ
jgi:hypothetical protein